MKDEIKQKRLAALLGIEYVPPAVVTPDEKRRRDDVSREAESVIAYLTEPSGFIKRECRICGGTFAVNRAHISCCSDDCRSKLLLDVYGLEVDLHARTPQERWAPNTGGREPLIVPPTVVTLLTPSQAESA